MSKNPPPAPFPQAPTLTDQSLYPASRILNAAHDSANSFFELFHVVRTNAKGTTADYEQDLLRAMLVFTSAALDNIMKRVIQDALPLVIERDASARKKLREFAESRIKGRSSAVDSASIVIDHKFLVELLLAPNPRAGVVDALIGELTASSLQSKEEVLKVCAYFGIDQAKVCPDVAKLQEAFAIRNQIVHEMDVNLAGTTRKRTSRRLSDMRDHTKRLFVLIAAFLTEVDAKLAKPTLPLGANAAAVP